MTNNGGRLSITRLAGVVLATALALTLAASTTALAEPEFKPASGTFTGLGLGPETFTAGGNSYRCTHNTASGTISSATLIGGLVVTFTGCTSSGLTKEGCPLLTVGVAPGTIVTKTLHAVLGLILPKGTGSGVGLLLLPTENKKFWTLEENECTIGTTVGGNIAGELIPVRHSQTTAKLVFAAASNSGESIKDFDLSTGGLVQPDLEFFGAEGSLTANEDLTFGVAIEIT